MGIFNKKKKITEHDIQENIKKMSEIYSTSVKKLVELSMKAIPIRDNSVCKFEASVFLIFRTDYFLTISFQAPDEIRRWFNNYADYSLSTIGSYDPEWLNIRMNLYSRIANYNNIDGKEYLAILYNTYFGLLKRASVKSDWWQSVEIQEDENIPMGGISSYLMSLELEEQVFFPLFKVLKEALEVIYF